MAASDRSTTIFLLICYQGSIIDLTISENSCFWSEWKCSISNNKVMYLMENVVPGFIESRRMWRFEYTNSVDKVYDFNKDISKPYRMVIGFLKTSIEARSNHRISTISENSQTHRLTASSWAHSRTLRTGPVISTTMDMWIRELPEHTQGSRLQSSRQNWRNLVGLFLSVQSYYSAPMSFLTIFDRFVADWKIGPPFTQNRPTKMYLEKKSPETKIMARSFDPEGGHFWQHCALRKLKQIFG